MQALTDNALMLKVKAGDLEKMGLLYERHKKRLFGFFYNMNSNASLSEDLVQNVFMRMLKYKHTFTGKGSFVAWMFQTARNVGHDHYRKNKKTLGNKKIDSMEINIETEDLNKIIDGNDTVSQLNRAMQKLSPENREILVLSKYNGIKFSEIAEILGCSEGAAKVKAHRALKDLRAFFFELEMR